MKLKFGLKRLDDAIGGGLDENTVNLVTGRSGIGKTILASHWAAEGAKNGMGVAYLATTLVKRSCETYLKKFRFMEDVYDKIHWRFIRVDAKYMMPVTRERIEQAVITTIKMKPEDVDMIVFDTVTDLDKALADPVLFRRVIKYMADLCYKNDITALFIEEAPMMGDWSETKNLSESVIFLDLLHTENGYERAMRILKKYRSSHPLEWIPYDITDEGIVFKEGWYVRRDYSYIYKSD
ncbi:RecA-superfamily ATPases implicated in signal transduction [Archaeoglobus sulfaticallidus PM70-1]|uniref:RecA-superfamily ATPases implicated in signal transduction n=1 Tax=Archaeoglobus sulfaticallidus PM70-1 TaxID=387631 RepID=N0BP42_9EURY|nr:RAD55 family ATPase [Archaeoglobus sulfaticallidus]AGK62115.1 RecA-superfamily ATPases implicated in signal transduction [Archaeoglobus sulfaticallidus PM70-1]